MAFQPQILQPTPDPWFIRELTLTDPSMRVVWAQERYLLHRWAIERRLDSETYNRMYHSVISGRLPRYMDQPIYDDDHPVYNPEGDVVSETIVGYRRFDLAPEFEWIRFVETRDGLYRPLGPDVLLELRREIAWNRTHPITRARIEQETKDRVQQQWLNQLKDLGRESIDELKSELGKRIVSRPYSQQEAFSY
jgi:hypothetical protein